MLTSRFSMWMSWGDDLTFFCNDAYRRDTLGVKYPWALGRSAREVWAEIWDDIGPRIDSVLRDGVATWDEALMLFLERSGYREETYHTFSYSPLVDDAGGRAGMLCVVVEETERVVGERRLATLRDLSASLATASTRGDIQTALSDVFDEHDLDLPFVALYHAQPGGPGALVGRGVDAYLDGALVSAVNDAIEHAEGGPWRLPPDAIRMLPKGAWDEPATDIVVVPVTVRQGAGAAETDEATSWLVAALNPFRPADETASFARLVARQVSASLGTVRAFEAERRRAVELEELDRAKTQFFSNVSHEFRTPLTLMLGPLDKLRRDSAQRGDTGAAQELEVIYRNGVRLGKLVNSLLEFSRIQAGRADARFEPIDIAALTEELVGSFRTVVELAGLELVVSCDKVALPVYVDPNMWERIVLNLMSNAVKYTFAGTVTVVLTANDTTVELSVSDTGIGIAAEDLPRVFDRFHRVENARARSAEGSGIGLALVAELVALHSGTITATSTPGVGSTFTVQLPVGRAHLPAERVVDSPTTATLTATDAFVAESLGWIEGGLAMQDARTGNAAADAQGNGDAAEVLIVDDNADMRAYLQRVLGEWFRTRTARDGAEALAAVHESRPDLVVSDVMMPNVDGYELARRLRADDDLSDLPIMLLTAQAGSTAELRSINVGADDYLVKPFSADDLLDRVRARLAGTRERRRRHRLARMVEALQRASEPDEVLSQAHAVAAEWFGVAHTTLAVLDRDGAYVQATHEPPFSAGISGRYRRLGVDAPIPSCAAIRERRAVTVADRDDVRRQFPEAADDYVRAGTHAALAVPLLTPSGTAHGSLTAAWSADRQSTDDDIHWFTQIASVVSDTLDRIRVAQRDQETLRAFQEQLLVINQRSPIAVVTARYNASADHLLVGGDWYDVSTRSDGALRLSIGDVVGKGLSAARVMAQLRSAVGTAAGWIEDPDEVLRVVDAYADQLPGALCATLSYMLLCPDGTLTWCSAGHPAPIVATEDAVIRLDQGRRPPLAARPDVHVTPGSATLEPGALLLLYTDGLIERRGEELTTGERRLMSTVRSVNHLPLDLLCDALLDALRPDDGYRDDVAILALHTCGATRHRFVRAHQATAAAARAAREELRLWLDQAPLEDTARVDVLLAVGESIANACEHGSAFDPRAIVGVEVGIHDGVLRAAISDHGHWTTDSSASAREGRGRGFAIMDHTMSRVDVRHTPLGTTVILERRVSDESVLGVTS